MGSSDRPLNVGEFGFRDAEEYLRVAERRSNMVRAEDPVSQKNVVRGFPAAQVRGASTKGLENWPENPGSRARALGCANIQGRPFHESAVEMSKISGRVG